jgi:dephospho-CoA kinase
MYSNRCLYEQEKVAKANLVIQNDGSLEDLLLRTRETLQRTAELVGSSRELQLD